MDPKARLRFASHSALVRFAEAEDATTRTPVCSFGVSIDGRRLNHRRLRAHFRRSSPISLAAELPSCPSPSQENSVSPPTSCHQTVQPSESWTFHIGALPMSIPTLTRSRWKAKGYSNIAAENPMSEIVKQLKSSLTHSRATAMLSGCVALLKANTELADLLERTCFGRQIITSEKDDHWFQLSSEETFYMHYTLQSLTVVNHNEIPINGLDLWNHMKNFKATFPDLYISYAHLRGKNWVVRAGAQYGVDFVAYRHHPSLVHSDYAVIVLQEGDANLWQNGRLRAWPDLHCSIRVSGSVAKSLLVLFVNRNGSDSNLLSSFEQLSVHERVITRWVAEQCREENGLEHA